jgi:hypothetical protein
LFLNKYLKFKDRKKVVQVDSESSSGETEATESNRPKCNLKFFDPEEYWCRVCNIFPDNAKEYLHHLHTQEHKAAMAVSLQQ